MDRHDRADAPIERIPLEFISQIDRNEPCLPVMAVNDVRLETDHGQNRKHGLGEKGKASDIVRNAVIGLTGSEIVLIIDKVVRDTVMIKVHDADIRISPVEGHIERSDVIHFVFPFLFDAGIQRHDSSYIKIPLVDIFRKRAGNIGQSSGLQKRYNF